MVRRAPYKDFLQPGLHRRFSLTALILLVIAYIQAVIFGWYNGWYSTFFPLGPAGIRTGLLAFCGLLVIILRIAQYHVGIRTSNSAFESFTHNVFKLQTLEALVTYTLSAWIFSQLWIWSGAEGLNWITYFSGDRARLNEKPLFLTWHFIILGCAQAFRHLFCDKDRLTLGVVKAGNGAKQGGNGIQLVQFVKEAGPNVVIQGATLAACSIGLSIFIYPFVLRGFVWRTTLFFLRPFYNLPRTNMLPSTWPFSSWTLVQCFLVGFMLSFAWLAGNEAFSTFLVREPLKNGQPLTSESKDPNGSLLNGLKSKKLAIRCFAMWELAFIARDYEIRRKGIYEDLDRKDGPMWSQVYAICLEAIRSMEARIDNYGRAPAAAPAAPAAPTQEKRRSTQAPKQDAILQSTPQKNTFRNEVEKVVNHIATDPSQPSQLSPLAKKAMESAKEGLLHISKEATGSDDPQSLFRDIAMQVLNTPLGWPFRQQFSRRLTAVVLGTPYGEPSLYVNAINALSLLAVQSLKEDKYGNVQRDVATIIRTFTTVTSKLESFKQGFPLHWTDVEKKRACPEVEVVLQALRDGLTSLIEAFGPYARDLRLSLTDMRLAKEAAGIDSSDQLAKRQDNQEMRQRR